MENNLEQLKKLAKIFNTDNVITSAEIEQVLTGIMAIMASFRKENVQLTEDNKQMCIDLMDKIKTEYNKTLENIGDKEQKISDTFTAEVSKLEKKFDKKLKKAQDLITELQAIEIKDGEDGKDADEEAIIAEVIKKIQLPEEIDLEKKGEEIIKGINSLPEENEYKIDASHIKNLPQFSGKNPNGGGWRNLFQMNDVSIDAPTNNQVLKYNSTTNIWENGTIISGVSIGDTITGATEGSILFAGVGGILAQDNSKLFYDNINNRFGLNTTSPQTALDIRGSGDLVTLYNGSNGGFVLSASTNLGGMSSASSVTALAFGINGATDSLYLTTDKRIGVRQPTPTALLHIKGQTQYEYLFRVEDSTGDMMLEIRDDINNSEGVLAKWGYMTTNAGSFDIAGYGTKFRGSGLLLYSAGIIQSDYYSGGGVLIASFLNDPSKYYSAAGAAPSAVLEAYSTTQGFLAPRMTTTQKNGIASPAEGLMVYDTTIDTPFFYDTTSSQWKQMSENYSGTYTPTLTGVANVASSTAYVCTYIRVGNAVTVSGEVEVTVSGANAQTLLGISLPISSDFSNSTECGGVGSTQGNSTAADTGSIHADISNKRAELDFFDTRGESSIISFTFTYQII